MNGCRQLVPMARRHQVHIGRMLPGVRLAAILLTSTLMRRPHGKTTEFCSGCHAAGGVH